MRNYTGNLLSSKSLLKMTPQTKHKKMHAFGSRFGFDLHFFFKKVRFLECVVAGVQYCTKNSMDH